MDREKIKDSLYKGVKKANKQFQGWVPKYFFGKDHYPEGVLVTNCCKEIRKIQSKSERIILEFNFKRIGIYSGSRDQLKLNQEYRSRADIVLLNSSSKPKPICPIEVKRYAEIKGINKDIERIQRLLKFCGPHVDGSLEFGFVLAVHWKENFEEINRNIERVTEGIMQFENEMEYEPSKIHSYEPECIEDWYFAPIIIEIDAQKN